MDFAKKQLEKYGWTEGMYFFNEKYWFYNISISYLFLFKGKGLGKKENGMQIALKPKPKCGLGGIGHNIADEFTNQWWHRVYDNAASNVEVCFMCTKNVYSFILI